MTRGTVLVVHYTPPGVIGGVEHIIEQHVRLLRERGYSVTLVAGRSGPSGTHVLPEIDAALPENIAIDEELAAGAIIPAFHEKRRAIQEKLAPLARESDIVIVHNAFTLHFSLPLSAALWQISGIRAPGSVIAWCHDLAWVNPLYLPALHAGYPWELLRRPAPRVRYVTVSAERRHELLGLWNGAEEAVTVVPNGVDVSSFLRLSPLTRELVDRHRLFARDVVLLLPVRITRRKNIELGIRVVRALKDRGLDVMFLVSGPQAPHHPGRSHDYLESLLSLRRQLDVDEQVSFLSQELGRNLDDEHLIELFSVADALLFPSTSEGFGIPILEAGLARLPAFVARIPIFEEVGGDDVWTFALEDDADRIAGEIMKALDTRPSRLRRRVLRDFNWDAVLEHHIVPLLHPTDLQMELPDSEIARDHDA